MKGRLLLLLGPPGTGKTTVIERLRSLDSRFVYVSPFVTRPLRNGENDKVTISDEEFDRRSRAGEMLFVNSLYGVRYGTPKGTVSAAFELGQFPVLDWPVHRLPSMIDAFPGQIFSVYLEPPSVAVLLERLRSRDGVVSTARAESARQELEALADGVFDGHGIDVRLIVEQGRPLEAAQSVLRSYLAALND